MLSIRENGVFVFEDVNILNVKKTEPSTFPAEVYGLELFIQSEFIVCAEGKHTKRR